MLMEVEVNHVAHFLAAAIHPPIVSVKRQLAAEPAAEARQRTANTPGHIIIAVALCTV